MPKEKKLNVHERATQFYWQQHQCSPLMKERHPDVRAIVVNPDLKDPDIWPGHPKPETHTFGREEKAFFQIRCPYGSRERVNGGGQLLPMGLGARPENEVTRQATCDGRQDQERIHRHRCMLEGNFEGIVRRVVCSLLFTARSGSVRLPESRLSRLVQSRHQIEVMHEIYCT